MRIAAIILCLLATPVMALPTGRPCPYLSFGWGQQWQATAAQPISSASYDGTAKVLYVVFDYNLVTAYAGVPFGVIQSFTYTLNPLQFYQTGIAKSYRQILLTPTDNCPLLQESGSYIYSH